MYMGIYGRKGIRDGLQLQEKCSRNSEDNRKYMDDGFQIKVDGNTELAGSHISARSMRTTISLLPKRWQQVTSKTADSRENSGTP
jgi:hypothetical protein